MKVHPVSHVIFENTRSEFIQIFRHCSVSCKITFFLAQTLYTLDKKSPSKWSWVKIHQFPHVIFELQSLFSVMRDNPSVPFQLKLYIIWAIQTFDSSREISPSLYFDRFLLFKVYKISFKKVHRSYVLWHWRVMQNLKKNQFVVSKMTRIWWILITALKVSRSCTLTGPFRI